VTAVTSGCDGGADDFIMGRSWAEYDSEGARVGADKPKSLEAAL